MYECEWSIHYCGGAPFHHCHGFRGYRGEGGGGVTPQRTCTSVHTVLSATLHAVLHGARPGNTLLAGHTGRTRARKGKGTDRQPPSVSIYPYTPGWSDPLVRVYIPSMAPMPHLGVFSCPIPHVPQTVPPSLGPALLLLSEPMCVRRKPRPLSAVSRLSPVRYVTVAAHLPASTPSSAHSAHTATYRGCRRGASHVPSHVRHSYVREWRYAHTLYAWGAGSSGSLLAHGLGLGLGLLGHRVGSSHLSLYKCWDLNVGPV